MKKLGAAIMTLVFCLGLIAALPAIEGCAPAKKKTTIKKPVQKTPVKKVPVRR